ncbi:MAG: adenosylcobinamide amidohydrolase [Nitrososphaerota archaeon]|nr:adenosylcobinamide amidohydrolase [Candidatus Bathyarchaeota archaeon]MDW8193504.1 adenosylcobinamide amidohydrolase [Nitrososphaerota archaeon]
MRLGNIVERRKINLNIGGVNAEILYHEFMGCLMKTLMLSFNGERRRILSTLDGYRRVMYVANVYVPSELSDFSMKEYPKFKRVFLRSLGLNARSISFISTGADMDNVAFCERFFQEFGVCCFATAGTGNALRSGVDKANYVERNGRFEYVPGTINIIILSNALLTGGAMARAIITATEAKTAVLQDLDVRSSSSCELQATGTGTDNIIVVSGREEATPITWTGGHTKMGELIGVCTRMAVLGALEKQEKRVLKKFAGA